MLPLVCVSLVVRNKRKCPFTCLACFHGKGVNEKSSAAGSSCRHDLKFGEIARLFARPRQRNVYLNACCTCSTIIFPHSTNQIFIFEVTGGGYCNLVLWARSCDSSKESKPFVYMQKGNQR